MNVLKQVPFLDMLMESKKAKMLSVLVSLFLLRDEIGLDMYALKYLTLGFCAYFIAQGLKDLGEALAEFLTNKEEPKEEAPTKEQPQKVEEQ